MPPTCDYIKIQIQKYIDMTDYGHFILVYESYFNSTLVLKYENKQKKKV